MEQGRVNEVLLELIGTGPCRMQEAGRVALQLLREEDPSASAEEVHFGLDQLDSQGLVGKTGHDRDLLVLSRSTEGFLNSQQSAEEEPE